MSDECPCNLCRGNPARIARIVIKPCLRNGGASLGLQYPYIYGRIHGRWLIWHRHTGLVMYVVPPTPYQWKGFEQQEASEKCHELNGVSIWPDGETLAAIDATP